MKKIGIIAFSNIRYSPYLKFYTNILSTVSEIKYEIIYFNRFASLKEETLKENYIPIKWIGKKQNKINKTLNFVCWRKRIKKLLKQNKYDFLIVLGTMPSVLLCNFLIKNYKNKYIVDIRDYSKENNKLYFKLEERVVNNSALNVISSKYFLNFLPKSEYAICHNLNYKDSNYPFNHSALTPIRIGYIGSISYKEQVLCLIKLVEKDERFSFTLYGNEVDNSKIGDYVNSINNSRIKMAGSFLPKEESKIYSKVDLVFNCYGNSSPLVKYAISNKYYNGAIFKKPLLVSPDTAMAEASSGFAFPLDLKNAQSLEELYEWYQKINEKEYLEFTNKVIEISDRQNAETSKKIIEILYGILNKGGFSK